MLMPAYFSANSVSAISQRSAMPSTGKMTVLAGAVAASDGTSYMERQMQMPVHRRPWPSVARTAMERDAEHGITRRLSPAGSFEPTPNPPDDCCPSSEEPLVFE